MFRFFARTACLGLMALCLLWFGIWHTAKVGGEPEPVMATVASIGPTMSEQVVECFDNVCSTRKPDSYRAVVQYESGRKCAFIFSPEVKADRAILDAGLQVGDSVLVDALRCHVRDWTVK